MIALLIAAVPLLGSAALGYLWRGMTMWRDWRPAAALVWATDYSEAEQADDRWGGGTLRGWRPLIENRRDRHIDEVVHYADADGEAHAVQLGRWVRRGLRPDGAHLIWYEVANPDHASAYGPGRWLAAALGFAAAAAALVQAGLNLRA